MTRIVLDGKITEVRAAVDYQDLLIDNAGVYMWLNPDEESTTKILRFMRPAPFKSRDGTELHVTVLYARAAENALPDTLDIPKDARIGAKIVRVDHWIDHKNRNVFVLALESPEITALHQCLTTQGLQHSYPTFNPHISIAKDLIMNAEQRLWLEEANEWLAKEPMEIHFSPQLRASPIA